MGRLSDLWYRLRALLSGKRMDGEFTEEATFHLDMETADLIRKGFSPAEARRRARLAFGGVERHREMARNARGARPLEDMIQDVRFALRTFRRYPAFTFAAVIILGTGIGATTTIYNVLDTVVLRPLPYPSPDRLVRFGAGIRPLRYMEWRDNLASFEAIGASWNIQLPLAGDGIPREVRASRVTPDLLGLFGATAQLGRLLTRDDYEGDGAVAVLSHGLWHRRWGGDPGVIGQEVRVAGQSVVIAGVMSSEFDPPVSVTGDQVDIWLPLDVADQERRRQSNLVVAGRMRIGTGREVAQQELNVLDTRMAEQYPDFLVRDDGSIRHVTLTALRDATVGRVAEALWLLTGAVGLMLLIACANMANLLLARGTARTREVALRRSLGASRSRILAQHLTESISLAVVGGALGLGLTFLGVSIIPRFLVGVVPRIQDLSANPRILFFALVITVGTGLVFGVLPAVYAARKNVGDALRDGRKSNTRTRRAGLTRNSLVVSEIAMAMVLLTSAGLFFRSLVNLSRVDPGFDTEELVTVRLSLRGDRFTPPQRQQFTLDVMDRIRAIPGVEAAAAGLTVPFEYVGASRCCLWSRVGRGDAREADGALGIVPVHPVTLEYFRALGTDVSYGRGFTSEDDAAEGRAAVLNEALARHLFGSENAVGQVVFLKGWDAVVTVVGVVPNLHHWGPRGGTEPAIYVPYATWGADNSHYHILARSSAGFETLVPVLREAIWAVAPDLPVDEVVPMRQRVEASTAGNRFFSILLTTFSCVALILATAGVYASMLFAVNQRRKEMGIHLALGARGAHVISKVLRDGMILSLSGIGIGLLASVTVTQTIRSRLWGVSATDPGTISSVIVGLVTATLLACLVPAWRASRADPLDTLRAE